MRTLRKRRINCHCTKEEVKSEGALKTNARPKLRRNMRDDEAENIPISLNLNNVKREAKVSPIRMNPPTSQEFSATRDLIKATPSKRTKSKLMVQEPIYGAECFTYGLLARHRCLLTGAPASSVF